MRNINVFCWSGRERDGSQPIFQQTHFNNDLDMKYDESYD